MAMVLKNNMPAVKVLNTLNKNASALSKSLQKVASGMKINGAGDDASGYAISERMRVQIRGLDQANANTQNAVSMMKTAEGALQSTVDILKTLKEKAIDAANDTNTDLDRATIQLEIDQMADQVDENASIMFNGRYLFDGSAQAATTVEQVMMKALNSEWIQNSLELIKENYGIDFYEDGTTVNEMEVRFEEITSGDHQDALAWVTHYEDASGNTEMLTMTVNIAWYSDMDWSDVNGSSESAGGELNYLDRTIAHEMTHAAMSANIQDFGSLPLYIVEGAAELIHGADTRLYYTVWTGMDSSTYSEMFSSVDGSSSDGQAPYAGGYALFRYLAAQSGGSGQDAIKRFMSVLDEKGAAGLDAAVSAASKGKFATLKDLTDSFLNHFNMSTTPENFYKNYCGINLYNVDLGAIGGQDAGTKELRNAESAVPEGGSTRYWIYPEDVTSNIDGLKVIWPTFQRPPGGWYFQTGTKANQNLHVALNDIHAEALGIKDREGNAISVRNYSDAVAAIRQLDKSLERAVNQQTTIGSIISRLDYTAGNLTTASENVQAAESVIRDSDMAKEMTEYTKHNILLQTAQSMLAQANQNASSVLSLLQ